MKQIRIHVTNRNWIAIELFRSEMARKLGKAIPKHKALTAILDTFLEKERKEALEIMQKRRIEPDEPI